MIKGNWFTSLSKQTLEDVTSCQLYPVMTVSMCCLFRLTIKLIIKTLMGSLSDKGNG